MTIRIDWHSRIQEIEALEEPWRALESSVVDRTVLVSFDHMIPWYRHYYSHGIQGKPLLGAAWEGSELIGIAPLVRRWSVLGRVPVRRIDFAGYSAEAGEFLVHDNRPDVVSAFLRSLTQTVGYDVIALNNMEAGSPKLHAIEEGAKVGRLSLERSEHCYATVELREGYEAYLRVLNSSLKGNVRRELKRRSTRIQEAGGIALDGARFGADPGRMAACVERMFALYDMSWKAKHEGRMAEHHRAFYRDLTTRFGRRSMADVSILTIGGVDAAYLIAIAERGVYYDISVSYRDDFAPLSPGLFLMQVVLRTLPSRGISMVISHGAHDYKRRWATGFPNVSRVFLFARGPRATISRLLKFRVAPAIGRTDPQFD
ncbi:MAG: GNAT family N-acetyltransferase [Nitrospiraceae bacterium]